MFSADISVDYSVPTTKFLRGLDEVLSEMEIDGKSALGLYRKFRSEGDYRRWTGGDPGYTQSDMHRGLEEWASMTGRSQWLTLRNITRVLHQWVGARREALASDRQTRRERASAKQAARKAALKRGIRELTRPTQLA